MASLTASVRRSVSVNSSICTFYSVVKLGPDFMHLLLCRCMMYQKSVAMKHITLNLMPICSTMCSVLALAVNAHIAESALLPCACLKIVYFTMM